MIQELLSYYWWGYPAVLVYMLQATEYKPAAYLKWCWRVHNFTAVMKRRELEKTGPVRVLLSGILIGIGLEVMCGATLLLIGFLVQSWLLVLVGVVVLVAYPFIWMHLIVLLVVLGRWLVIKPRQCREIDESEAIFAKTRATKVAVAGSYGKTTMKELLVTVLGTAKKVAATPENKNVAIAHAALAKRLQGDEDVIIIEYGEGRPGDVASFAKITNPDIGIITGLAPAHLDTYKTTAAAGVDICSLADYVPKNTLYVNGESEALKPFIQPEFHIYDSSHVLNWRISGVHTTLEGVEFTMKQGRHTLKLKSQLLGRHLVASIALAAALAHTMGLSKADIERGVSATKPFAHRMEPRKVGAAYVIDDTYNGNIEGMRAGLALLAELPGKRKLYVTPGLVDQGKETQPVHRRLGLLIAASAPDIVVLMHNSVTDYIQEGLQEGGYQGRVLIENDPLSFYADLGQVTAAGDLVLMQNDWTDNYA